MLEKQIKTLLKQAGETNNLEYAEWLRQEAKRLGELKRNTYRPIWYKWQFLGRNKDYQADFVRYTRAGSTHKKRLEEQILKKWAKWGLSYVGDPANPKDYPCVVACHVELYLPTRSAKSVPMRSVTVGEGELVFKVNATDKPKEILRQIKGHLLRLRGVWYPAPPKEGEQQTQTGLFTLFTSPSKDKPIKLSHYQYINAPRHHFELFDTYLKVYDMVESNPRPKWRKVAEAVYPGEYHAWKDQHADRDHPTIKKVKHYYRVAKAYVTGRGAEIG